MRDAVTLGEKAKRGAETGEAFMNASSAGRAASVRTDLEFLGARGNFFAAR